MIWHSIDRDNRAVKITTYSAYIAIQLFFDMEMNQWKTLFSAKNNMQNDITKRLRHKLLSMNALKLSQGVNIFKNFQSFNSDYAFPTGLHYFFSLLPISLGSVDNVLGRAKQ